MSDTVLARFIGGSLGGEERELHPLHASSEYRVPVRTTYYRLLGESDQVDFSYDVDTYYIERREVDPGGRKVYTYRWQHPARGLMEENAKLRRQVEALEEQVAGLELRPATMDEAVQQVVKRALKRLLIEA